MKKSFTIFFCLLAIVHPARADEMAAGENMKARLLSAYSGTGKLSALDLGLDVAFAPGWYSYWRMPGDNGLAPVFDWKNSTNVRDVKISWPAPARFTLADMHSFGYKEEVLFPLTITPETPGRDVTLDLNANFVVCHDICVPETLHLSKTVPAGSTVATEDFALLKKAREDLPAAKNTDALGIENAVLGKDSVVVSAYAKGGFASGAELIVETPGGILTAPPEIIPDEADKNRAILKVRAREGLDLSKELFGKTVTVVLIHDGHALERPFSF